VLQREHPESLHCAKDQVATGVDGALAVVVRGWREVIVRSQWQERRRRCFGHSGQEEDVSEEPASA
jgi:hypothetical protein